MCPLLLLSKHMFWKKKKKFILEKFLKHESGAEQFFLYFFSFAPFKIGTFIMTNDEDHHHHSHHDTLNTKLFLFNRQEDLGE